ncbi:MAG: hypothetical protein ACXACP_14270 [Candidatus Hodarchaeales archaeon]
MFSWSRIQLELEGLHYLAGLHSSSLDIFSKECCFIVVDLFAGLCRYFPSFVQKMVFRDSFSWHAQNRARER